MSKLLYNGIRGGMQSWFKSCLGNRKQYVSTKNCSSSRSNITLGVPQGSVSGTVLFFWMSMTCIDPHDSDINDVHGTVNRELV